MSKRYLPYLIYLALSILVVLFSTYAYAFVRFVINVYQYVDAHISVFFSHSQSGLDLRHVFALVICPLLFSGIPALSYRFIKGSPMPYFIEVTWLIWLLLVISRIFMQ